MESKVQIKVREDENYEFMKRILDIVIAIPIGFIGVFLVAISAICIKLEDGGPILYKQERLGKNEKLFYVYKLRSMRIDAEKNGAQWADKNDSRVTKIGRVIRLTRIDEIPQLYNILTGDMSMIGPRPERPMFTEQFNNEIPGFKNRLLVKPGLTGWAQVTGGYEMTPEEKFKADIYYIENRSLKLDINILIKTISVVLTGEGAR